MITFLASGKNNQQTVGIGITAENVERLKAGQPIHLNGANIGINLDILILYGETYEALQRDLSPGIGPNTIIRDNRELS